MEKLDSNNCVNCKYNLKHSCIDVFRGVSRECFNPDRPELGSLTNIIYDSEPTPIWCPYHKYKTIKVENYIEVLEK